MELLAIENMKVQYSEFVALDINQTITINAGDRIGIIGSNGAGKSTLVKAVCGLAHFTGKIKTELKHTDIAIHLQENSYIKRMPVKMIIEAVLNTNIKDNEKLKCLIHFLDFEHCLKKNYGQLSGGQKQKLTIAIVLFQDRPLTFFDEVTSALDFETRQKLMEKMNEWYSGKPNAVCVVSHYYDELENLCNKLMIIDKGQVIAFDSIDSLFKTYCGQSVLIIKNDEDNIKLTENFKKIAAPKHLLALSCGNDEGKLIELLTKNGISFKRSNRDIEILFANAVAAKEGLR